MHIPVIPEEQAWATRQTLPDAPWNFLDELLVKEKGYRARGGKFIVPIRNPG